MANEILIKRSNATVEPASLLFGELAFGSNGELFIGNKDGGVSKIASDDMVTKSYVDDQVTNTVNYVDSEVADLTSALNTEIFNLSQEDTRILGEAKSYTDASIATVVGAAPAVLDTLQELAAALGNDENFATTMASSLTDLQNKIDAVETGSGLEQDGSFAPFGIYDAANNAEGAHYAGEATTMKAAIKALDAALHAEAGNRSDALDDAKAYTDQEVLAEKQRAEGIENGLRTDLNKEIQDRADEITRVETLVSDEKSRAEGIEGGLRTDLNQEISDRVNAVDAVNTRVDNLNSAQVAHAAGSAPWATIGSQAGAVGTVEAAINALLDGVVSNKTTEASNNTATNTRIDNLTASEIAYDDSVTSLAAGNTQEAIEALKTLIGQVETLANERIDDLTAGDILFGNSTNAQYFAYALGAGVGGSSVEPQPKSVREAMFGLNSGIQALYNEINAAAEDGSVVLASMATQSKANVEITGGVMSGVAISNVTINDVVLDGGSF